MSYILRSPIYSSKLYQASNYKADITAAMNDPVNMELVQQINSYLDDEYQPLTHRPESDANVKDNGSSDNNNTEGLSDGPSNHSPSSHGGGGPFIPSNIDLDEFEEDTELNPDEELDIDDGFGDGAVPEDADDIEDNEPVEESTILEPVVANSTLCTITQDTSEEIKGLLNMSADTQGVIRIQVKDEELWIYYNDDTNLNNVMSNVVDKLNSSNYTYLEFNRLARSANAIVFQISCIDSTNNVDPISEEDK